MKLFRIYALALLVVVSMFGCSSELEEFFEIDDKPTPPPVPALTGTEIWGCVDRFEASHPHEIELAETSNLGIEGIGAVKIQGIPEITTLFEIEGINRAWRWDDYLFVIEPEGTGLYYVFLDDEPTKPSQFYDCHKH